MGGLTTLLQAASVVGMAKKSEGAFLTAGALVLVGLWLVSRPQCNRGCKTVAEHLIEHGISDFIGGLLA